MTLAFSWDRRLARARELAALHPAASDLLAFYEQLAGFQKGVYKELSSAKDPDLPVLLPFFTELISLVKRSASPALVAAAGTIQQDSAEDRLALLEAVWRHQVESRHLIGEDAFFSQALLQPYAEYLADCTRPSETNGSSNRCPFCGSRPQLAVLRPEGDGAKKFLACSLCSTEWSFRRLLCPNCGQEDKEKLPVFAAEEFDYIRLDACDSCHTYLKSIDLSKNGRAVPVVDELATVSLNLWAQENHYQKVRPNLFGV